MKVLVLDGVSEKAIAILRENGIQADVSATLPLDELIAKIPDYEGMIVRSQTKVTKEVIEAGAKLKIIGRAGVGVDNVDTEAATQRGIIVMNAPDGNTISTAEHTIAMLMSLARYIPQAHASLKAGQWDRKNFTGVEVNNKVLGVIGMGRIGTEVAKRMQAMGMSILAYDPFLTEDRAEKLGVKLATVEEIVVNSDFITVHTPLNADTKNLLNAEAFAKMKKGVRLVNCARGGIIDENALADAIEAGKVAGAALDVYPEEPPTNRRAIDLPQVVATPHLGASTHEAQVNVAIDVAIEMSKALKGDAFKNAVNIPAVRPEVLVVVKPYLALAEKLGNLITQLVGGRMDKVEVSYDGELAEYDLSSLTTLVMKGILQPVLDDEVNMVNAPILAKQRGIQISEKKNAAAVDYTNRITVKVQAGKDVRTVAGTLFRQGDERVVEIDGYYFEVVPHGYLLVITHSDKPGMIGKVGTILGEAGVNIAFMQVGRKDKSGKALMVLTVDSAVDKEVLAKVSTLTGIDEVRLVKL